MRSPDANIARHLAAATASRPGALAVRVPRGTRRDGSIRYADFTLADLDAEAAAWHARLAARGVRAGDRTLLLVRPGLPLIAVTFALFRAAAVPVLLDPGMGLVRFLECVRRTRPVAVVGITPALLASHVFRRSFAGVRARVRVPSALAVRLAPKTGRPPTPAPHSAQPEDLAAILFTSGSTGAAKGVPYSHGQLAAQVEAIRNAYDILPGEVDLTLLPVFALFNPLLGMTTVVPEVDPRRPAELDPERVVQAIRQCGVTNAFGAPPLWEKIASYVEYHGGTLPSVKRLLLAGAPVPRELVRRLRAILPQGDVHTPYGSTEALPVTSAAGCLLAELPSSGQAGTCVGRPLPGFTVRVVPIVDGPRDASSLTPLPEGEVGEIVVRGPTVTGGYDGLPDATAMAKVPSPEGIWHRMGDLGWMDAEGRLWFVGRRAERVETERGPLDTEPVEQVFRAHPAVRRAALIGLGARPRQTPAVVIEPRAGRMPRSRQERESLAQELLRAAVSHPGAARVERVFFRRRLPVDVRHNAKIHRLRLARDYSRGFRPCAPS